MLYWCSIVPIIFLCFSGAVQYCIGVELYRVGLCDNIRVRWYHAVLDWRGISLNLYSTILCSRPLTLLLCK